LAIITAPPTEAAPPTSPEVFEADLDSYKAVLGLLDD
jgi:hypothetical protein